MTKRPRDADRTKNEILAAARRLFAERAIEAVSIRDIAAEAGVSHGLIQQYFGTREKLVAGIIKREIDAVMDSQQPVMVSSAGDELALLRGALKAGAERFRDFAMMITRAELAGLEPEKMLDPAFSTPAMHLASTIAAMQARCPDGDTPPMDPKLASAYVNAALFGFGAMAPWLMASVGLTPQEYEKRFDEIIDITIGLVGWAGRAGSR